MDFNLRLIYLLIICNELLLMLMVFDFVDLNFVVGECFKMNVFV